MKTGHLIYWVYMLAVAYYQTKTPSVTGNKVSEMDTITLK